MTRSNASSTLDRLRRGNERFVSGRASALWGFTARERERLVSGQSPIAVVLGCSDSRVPPEVVFDCGLGELFVVRVAGQVAGPIEIGSIEYAVEVFGTGLVVVLGHSGCGAVTGALAGFEDRGVVPVSPNLEAVLGRIQPALGPLLEVGTDANPAGLPAGLMDAAVTANVRAAATGLGADSKLLAERLEGGELVVAGAVYQLATGVVEFLEDQS